MTRKTAGIVVALIAPAAVWLNLAEAREQAQQTPPPPMTFFITSVGSGNGGNLGGLVGADKQCQSLAAAVGAGNRTWRAYLSAAGAGAQLPVNARDRIGSGP